ncbi:MAG: hypothetical protein WBL68_05315 [Nitrososphaeraceae archaeon]
MSVTGRREIQRQLNSSRLVLPGQSCGAADVTVLLVGGMNRLVQRR